MKRYFLKLFFIGLILAAFGYFIWKNIGTINSTYQITTRNLTGYLLVAAALSFVSEAVITKVYQKIFSRLKIIRGFLKMMRLHLAGIAISIIIPSAGFASALVYAEDTKKEESRAAAVTGFLLAGIADYSAVAILLIFAMLYLSAVSGLGLSVLIPAMVFIGLTLFLYFLVWVSAKELDFAEKFFKKILDFVAKIINKFSKKRANSVEATESFLKEFSMASKYILKNRKVWLWDILSMTGFHLIRIAILYVIFLSLGFDPTYRALITGYAIGTLFVVISPTPSGIGIVEGAMVLSYSSMGVPTTLATTAVLIYRALVFWIPFFIGFVILQGSRIKKIKEEALELEI